MSQQLSWDLQVGRLTPRSLTISGYRHPAYRCILCDNNECG